MIVSTWKLLLISTVICGEIHCKLQSSESDIILIQGNHVQLHTRNKRDAEASLSKIRNSGRARCGKVRVKQNKKDSALESVLVNLISAYDLNRKRAQLGEFPWIAALIVHKNGQTFYCGGSLIDHWHILTAASCVATLIPDDLRNMKVLLGSYDIYNSYEINRIEARVAQVAYHKEFDSLRMENNIALIKLSEPIRYSDFIQPVCLPNGTLLATNSLAHEQAVLAGWGQMLFEPLEHLHKLNLQVWDNERCVKRYNLGKVDEESPFPSISRDSLCAGTPVSRSKSLCQGNNGSPLVLKRNGRFQLIGIVSWGIGAEKYPCVFTRVDLHSQWIQRGIASFD